MPDPSDTPPKVVIRAIGPALKRPRQPFVELGLTSCFTFLRGASDAVEYSRTASGLKYDALGIADLNSMAGVVRMHVNLKGMSIRPVIGCRILLACGRAFLAYPRDRPAYGRLCSLLTKGKRFDEKGEWQDKDACHLTLDDLAEHSEGMFLIALPDQDIDRFAVELPRLVSRLPALGHIAASYLYSGDDRARIDRLDKLARRHGLGLLATNDVHYHAPSRRPLQDVITCIREGTTLAEAGRLLHANAERHLKSPEEMVRLFAQWPHAIAASREIADACRFSLDELKYEYPEEAYPESRTAHQHLHVLVWRGAAEHYPHGVPRKVKRTLKTELRIIGKLEYARYFLTVHDIVMHARSLKPPILCQGRGSAANSAVCYVLGITSVNPTETELLFERFVAEKRDEPPDIDVDFEHERREEVIQHIYAKYGRGHAGLCATVIHYRPRSAIREVGKVMGLSPDVTSALASTIWGSWGKDILHDRVGEAGLGLDDPHLQRAIALAEELIDKPRHLSQHVGGFILTRSPLCETVPIGNGAMPARSFIEWEKDDIDELGILKIDVLALGMLTCVRKSFDLIEQHGGRSWTLADIPRDDEAVYNMLCKGDSLGVFQVESRAQMNMLPRLKPREFYDLVVEVAIVRPGPIQGDMVHPYLKRRRTKEVVVYPSPYPHKGPKDELESILKRTKGVPIFQEQAMKIAIDAAEFTPEEANELRRMMATFRNRGKVETLQARMVEKMVERGYDRDFAQNCFNQIKGFGEYGFPESHAASFAKLVYISAWIKCHHPAVFACALLNSQPMGFYAPAQIVRDAREHGVEVRAPDVNHSDWDCTLEPAPGSSRGSCDGGWALRLGLRQVEGLARKAADAILGARDQQFVDVEDVQHRSGVDVAAIQRLAAADAFRSVDRDRRAALWDSRTLRQAPDLPLFRYADARPEGGEGAPVRLPETHPAEHVVSDYQTMRLSLKAHPLSFLRERLDARRFTPAADLRSLRYGRSVRVSGLVLIRQKPGTAKGVCFITLEDETGVINLVIWPDIMKRYRREIMAGRMLEVEGSVQMDEAVIHVVARRIRDASAELNLLSADLFPADYARADHVVSPLPSHMRDGGRRHPRDAQIIPKSRDFH